MIAFVSTRSAPGIGIYVMNADGSNQTRIGNGGEPDWSPDSRKIAYVRHDSYDECQEGEVYELREINPDDPPGAGFDILVEYAGEYLETPVWSPDGRQFVYVDYVFDSERYLYIENLFHGGPFPPPSPYGDYRSPDWQPLRPPGYARPLSATPASVALVPGFRTCSSASGSHGPPLTAASCNPPQQASDHLTVGTPDANGASANSTGSVTFRVFCHPPDQNGVPECPAAGDQIDVALTASLTDVRNKVGLTDYTGELRVSVTTRITDRLNGAGGVHPATVSDTPLDFNLTCLQTAAEPIG
jgi:WD40 repeat protein